MFRILLLLILGMGVGFGLRHVKAVRRVDHTTRITIYILLFVFGTSVGVNRGLMAQLGRFGWEAAAIAAAGFAGSFGAACLLQRLMSKKGGAR